MVKKHKPYKSKFVISEHHAKRAGKHYDVRFKMPDSKLWFSSATKKQIPLKFGDKVSLWRTHDHSEKEALMVGFIEDGYGAGQLKDWDKGKCTILKWEPTRHIVIDFKGRKIKGIYHILAISVIGGKKKWGDSKNKQYLFFKAKEGYTMNESEGNPLDIIDHDLEDGYEEMIMKTTIKEAEVNLDILPHVMSFFKNTPAPSESDIARFCQEEGIDQEEFKAQTYRTLGDFVGFGRAVKEGLTEDQVDPHELEMGIDVEYEHTRCPVLSKRISLDHLTEIPDYYTRLDHMEKQAGITHHEILQMEAANVVKGIAKKSGKSEEEVEVLWDKAKKIVKKEYPEIKKDTESYYKILTGVTKKMSGIKNK